MRIGEKGTVLLIQAPGFPASSDLIELLRERYSGSVLRCSPEKNADFCYQDVGDPEPIEAAVLKIQGPVAVILLGFDADFQLPRKWLLALASLDILEISRFNEETQFAVPHRPLRSKPSRTLVVFPGNFIPLNMGSHQRVFHLLAGLAERGSAADLLIMTGKSDLAETKPILYQMVPRIFGYRNSKKKLPPRMLYRRWVETQWRKLHGETGPVPELFEERLERRSGFAACKALRRLADSGRYENIIINYAWLAMLRKLLPPTTMARIRWICDTHDVQYIRGETENRGIRRWGVSREKEKACEVKILKSFHRVLALSKSDASVLEEELGKEKVIFVPTGFDYAQEAPRLPDLQAPVFGFIGSKMAANVQALSIILTDWWPRILERWPKSKLRIAGSVAVEQEILEAAVHRDDIVIDGIVPLISTWYRGIDVLLNPVTVQGGLNFKSVEALMSCRLLVTNELGSKCLGDPGLAIVIKDNDELCNAIESELGDLKGLPARRLDTQKKASHQFGDEAAYSQLEALLRQPWKGALRTRPGGLRVLIQCGDSFENRERLLPLALAIRARGHSPVVLVYSHEYIAPFLARGVDALALYDFNETPSQKFVRLTRLKMVKGLSTNYVGYDLDDIADVAQLQKPERFENKHLRSAILNVTKDVDRVTRALRYVKPDVLFVWNGFTGYTANVLRQYARNHGIGACYLERSIFRDSAFIDPRGVNGNSELSLLSVSDLHRLAPKEPPRPITRVVQPVSPDEVEQLRASGPWAKAKQIIFIPLQVQSDTNILYFSPEFKSMAELVEFVHFASFNKEAAIIVRPHPEEVAKDLELPKFPNVFVDSRGSLQAWLEIADLVVTINSTVGLEAILRQKPTLAIGYSIYSAKGIDSGERSDSQTVQAFWNTLTSRFTAIPGLALPSVLEEFLPKHEGARPAPINKDSRDPEQVNASVREKVAEIREKAIAHGSLSVVVANLPKEDFLNLTYRKNRERVTPEWILQRVAKELQLPGNVRLAIEDKKNASMPSIEVVGSGVTGKSGLLFDRYLWPFEA